MLVQFIQPGNRVLHHYDKPFLKICGLAVINHVKCQLIIHFVWETRNAMHCYISAMIHIVCRTPNTGANRTTGLDLARFPLLPCLIPNYQLAMNGCPLKWDKVLCGIPVFLRSAICCHEVQYICARRNGLEAELTENQA